MRWKKRLTETQPTRQNGIGSNISSASCQSKTNRITVIAISSTDCWMMLGS